MSGFIIAGLLLTVTVGWFMGLIAVGGFPERGELAKKIIMVVVAFAVGFGIAGIMALESNHKAKEWNNGYCPTCVQPWRLVNVEHIRNHGERYYYTCDKCGKIICQ